jgi:hypothetical protein
MRSSTGHASGGVKGFLYAGKIKEATNGRRRSIGCQARRKAKIKLERCVETNGEIHVSKATGGFRQNKTEKASHQEKIAADSGWYCQSSTTTPGGCGEQRQLIE